MTAQSRIDWLKQRQSGIGGSEIAAIVGLNQFKTPMQIFDMPQIERVVECIGC
jgi:predicted phage-related endonuclease